MVKYASGLFYFSFFFVIAIWIFADYLYQSAALKELKVYQKQDSIQEYYDSDKEYTLVTSQHDTLTITKAYSPGLTIDSLRQLYGDKLCRIYYSENEIVKLTQDNVTFVDINYLEIKKQYLKDGPLAGFYGILGACLLILLVTLAIPKFETWTKRKNEQAILMIPHTRKIGDDLFEYKDMDKEAILHNDVHFQLSKIGNRNVITVYFPRPEHLSKPIKMEIDAFQGGKYYNFTHKNMFYLNYKKLQQKIESKFA